MPANSTKPIAKLIRTKTTQKNAKTLKNKPHTIKLAAVTKVMQKLTNFQIFSCNNILS